MTRQDTLKERHSSAGCEKKRRITKNCKDKDDKNIRQSKNSFIMLNQSNHFPYYDDYSSMFYIYYNAQNLLHSSPNLVHPLFIHSRLNIYEYLSLF